MAAEQAAVEKDPDIFGPGLNTQLNLRVTISMYAQIQMRALVESTEPAKVARRWLRAGAKAEGFDLDSLT